MITVKNNVSSCDLQSKLYKWVINNDYLDTFNTNTKHGDTDRKAFAVTYSHTNIPDMFEIFKDDYTNIYNIIGIITYTAGDIPKHIDDDLTCYMRSINIPNIYIKYPHITCVYYVDVCKEMIGGQTVFDNNCLVTPVSNMLMCFPSGLEHSVTAIKSSKSPRVVVVCEKYKLLRSAIRSLNTPPWRAG
jgi:hypothetical protein